MSEWRTTILDEICFVNPEQRDRTYPHQRVNYIDISSVASGEITSPPQELLLSEAPSRAQRIVRQGDILVSTVRPNRRSFVMLGEVPPNTLASTGFAVLRAKNSNDPNFIYGLIRDQSFTDYLVSRAEGSAYPAVNSSVFKEAEIVIPEPPEQFEIGTVLSSLDKKILTLKQQNETLEAMARAIFKSWFVDCDPVRAKAEGRTPEGMDAATAALFPSTFTDSPLGPIPDGWSVGPLSSLCDRVENGGTPKRTEPTYWEDGTIPWLTSGEVRQAIILSTNNYITEEGLKGSSAKIWPTGTTVVAMYGATAGEVSLLAVPVSTNQACCGLIPKPLYGPFLFMLTRAARKDLASKASGSAQQNLSQGLVANHNVLIPSEDVIKAYGNVVSLLFEKWVGSLQTSVCLSELRDTLLPRLISGKLRLTDAQALTEDAA